MLSAHKAVEAESESTTDSSSDQKVKMADVPILLAPSSEHNPSCFSVSALWACVIAIVCASVFFGRDYVQYVLLSLENSNAVTSLLIFSLLFAAVSFPVTWG